MSFLIFVLVTFTGFLDIQITQTLNMYTFSTRRYPLGSSSSLHPRDIFHSTGDGRQFAKSTTTCVLDEGLSPTTRVVPYMGHRPHFPERVFRGCQGFHACAQGGSSVTQGPLLPNGHTPQSKGKGDKRKKDSKKKSNGQAPSDGTSDADGGGDTSEAETPQNVLFPTHQSSSSQPTVAFFGNRLAGC